MKLRTDFVTNSSSSAFAAVLVNSKEVSDLIRKITNKAESFTLNSNCCGCMEVEGDTIYVVSEAEELFSSATCNELNIIKTRGGKGRTSSQINADYSEINQPDNAFEAINRFLPRLSPEDDDALMKAIDKAYYSDKIGFELWEDMTDGFDCRRPTSLGRIDKSSVSKLDDFVIKNGELVKYKGRSANVVIPYGVTSIGPGVFTYNDKIRSVVIPSSMKYLPKAAFLTCTNLKKVVIPETLTAIGSQAFQCCYKLADENGFIIVNGILFYKISVDEELVIPKGVKKISEYVFKEYTGLKRLVIPEGVIEIGDLAFMGCSELEEVVLPESLQRIGKSAFSGCCNLSRIVIPEGVSEIGEYAFADCKKMIEVNLPSGAEFGRCVFSNCSGLTTDDGMVIVDKKLVQYCGKDTNITVPDGITAIWDWAFTRDWFSENPITSVRVPKTVTNIRRYAFYQCKNLEEIILNDSLSEVGRFAFGECINLSNSNVPKTVKRIDEGAFYDCPKLIDDEGFVIRGDVLFGYYGDGSEVTVPPGVAGISYSAFKCCKNISFVILPDSVKEICEQAFWECESLSSVNVPEGVAKIGKKAFAYCGSLKSLVLPENTCELGDSLIHGCKKIQSVWIKSASVDVLEKSWGGALKTVLVSGCGDNMRFYACSTKTNNYDYHEYRNSSGNLREFAARGRWSQYDLELINNGPAYDYRIQARLLGGADRLRHPIELNTEAKTAYVELLTNNVKKVITLSKEFECPWMVGLLVKEGIINSENKKTIQKIAGLTEEEKALIKEI